jgi:hypothetical protein
MRGSKGERGTSNSQSSYGLYIGHVKPLQESNVTQTVLFFDMLPTLNFGKLIVEQGIHKWNFL